MIFEFLFFFIGLILITLFFCRMCYEEGMDEED